MKNQASDLPIRIKNGYLALKQSIVVDDTKMTRVILELLKAEGYVGEFVKKGEGTKSYIEVDLIYKNRTPVLSGVKIISKPGRRVYESVRSIKPVLGGLGIAIISTPEGMITDKMAREKKVGGEVLFYMW
ncbi:MAG: 30S ribosomal protein S8 [Microgenomates group bacterium]